MTDDMAAMEIEDTRPRRAEVVEDRLQQLRAELEVKGRLNAALAHAAGIDDFPVPAELLREIEEVEAQVRDIPRLSTADLPEDLRRALGLSDDRHGPPPARHE
jgi:hypothetical protein